MSYNEFVDVLARDTVTLAAMGKRGMQSKEAMGVADLDPEFLGHKRAHNVKASINETYEAMAAVESAADEMGGGTGGKGAQDVIKAASDQINTKFTDMHKAFQACPSHPHAHGPCTCTWGPCTCTWRSSHAPPLWTYILSTPLYCYALRLRPPTRHLLSRPVSPPCLYLAACLSLLWLLSSFSPASLPFNPLLSPSLLFSPLLASSLRLAARSRSCTPRDEAAPFTGVYATSCGAVL